jgi:hypothetical protein
VLQWVCSLLNDHLTELEELTDLDYKVFGRLAVHAVVANLARSGLEPKRQFLRDAWG